MNPAQHSLNIDSLVLVLTVNFCSIKNNFPDLGVDNVENLRNLSGLRNNVVGGNPRNEKYFSVDSSFLNNPGVRDRLRETDGRSRNDLYYCQDRSLDLNLINNSSSKPFLQANLNLQSLNSNQQNNNYPG